MKDARLYLVAPARLRAGSLAELVPELAAAGVDVIQLREKDMEAGDLLRLGEPLVEACRSAGIPFVVNDRPDIALALGADGVHLGQNDLPLPVAHRILGHQAIVGLSSHSEAEIDRITSISSRPSYFAVGPVFETPTKPGRPSVGLDLVRYATTKGTETPWFAIGGINRDNVDEVMDAGARRVVVVRAITEAGDPVRAARELKDRLERQVP